MSDYICRLMQETELEEVNEFVHKAGDFAWSSLSIQESFLSSNDQSFVLIAEHDNAASKHPLLGYAVIQTVLDESHLLNIVIKKQEQGKGLGTYFLQQIIGLVKQENQASLLLEVRSSNSTAIKLYENLGFKRNAIRKNYYPALDGREDAWLYSLSLE